MAVVCAKMKSHSHFTHFIYFQGFVYKWQKRDPTSKTPPFVCPSVTRMYFCCKYLCSHTKNVKTRTWQFLFESRSICYRQLSVAITNVTQYGNGYWWQSKGRKDVLNRRIFYHKAEKNQQKTLGFIHVFVTIHTLILRYDLAD